MKKYSLGVSFGILAATVAACGTKSSTTTSLSSGTFTGSVAEKTLSVHSAVFAVVDYVAPPAATNAYTGKALLVVASDANTTCASAATSSFDANHNVLYFSIASRSVRVLSEPTAGAFTATTSASMLDSNNLTGGGSTPAAVAFGGFYAGDANCINGLTRVQSDAASGTVTLKSFKAEANGTAEIEYTLAFGASDTATGTLTATYCADLSNLTAPYMSPFLAPRPSGGGPPGGSTGGSTGGPPPAGLPPGITCSGS